LNSDELKNYKKDYYNIHKEKIRKYHKEYYQKHKDRIRQQHQEWDENNPDKRQIYRDKQRRKKLEGINLND
jgi:hypothetical protein